MQTTSYLAAEDIEQGDLLSYFSATVLAVLLKRADSGDAIIARAAQDCKQGGSIQVTLLDAGATTTVICGGSISAGDHIDGADGKAVRGTSSLVAIDAGSTGDRIRVVKTASDNSPAVADKAKALDLSAVVGSESQGVYFKADGKPYPTTGGGFQVSSLWAHSDAHIPQVGAIALFAYSNGGGVTSYYGDEVTVTRADLSKTETGLGLMIPDRLAFDYGSRTSGASVQYKTLGSGSLVMPVGTKVRILGGNLDINQGVILGIVTYLPEPTPAA